MSKLRPHLVGGLVQHCHPIGPVWVEHEGVVARQRLGVQLRMRERGVGLVGWVGEDEAFVRTAVTIAICLREANLVRGDSRIVRTRQNDRWVICHDSKPISNCCL